VSEVSHSLPFYRKRRTKGMVGVLRLSLKIFHEKRNRLRFYGRFMGSMCLIVG